MFLLCGLKNTRKNCESLWNFKKSTGWYTHYTQPVPTTNIQSLNLLHIHGHSYRPLYLFQMHWFFNISQYLMGKKNNLFSAMIISESPSFFSSDSYQSSRDYQLYLKVIKRTCHKMFKWQIYWSIRYRLQI